MRPDFQVIGANGVEDTKDRSGPAERPTRTARFAPVGIFLTLFQPLWVPGRATRGQADGSDHDSRGFPHFRNLFSDTKPKNNNSSQEK